MSSREDRPESFSQGVACGMMIGFVVGILVACELAIIARREFRKEISDPAGSLSVGTVDRTHIRATP